MAFFFFFLFFLQQGFLGQLQGNRFRVLALQEHGSFCPDADH